MSQLHHVLHTSARPIGLLEFVDALRATCKPRFPHVNSSMRRPVGLAISGGVDSMALAYLCSQLRRYDPLMKITDNPLDGYRAWVVDHGLRENSEKEAIAVRDVLVNLLGLNSEVFTINWNKEVGPGTEPSKLPNFESVARKARYRVLGRRCAMRRMATLLLAHHEDDQYETVMMRLLSGYRGRGLRGMRKACEIPECEGMFGTWSSGWVDDQQSHAPFYKTTLSGRMRKYLKQDLRDAIIRQMKEDAEQTEDDESIENNYLIEDTLGDFHAYGVGDFVPTNTARYVGARESPSIPIEDGGVRIYRPLLEFSKDRLVATCLHSNIPWFEDHTNQDPTMTMRNAVRHMYKNCQLPRALQKPSILALAARTDRRARADDAEADRLLEQTILHDFQPNVGSLVVQFPEINIPKPTRYPNSAERYRRRVAHKRVVAGLLIQRIISLVGPEMQTTAMSNLQTAISQLFRSLSDPSGYKTRPPKAFSTAGLHFMSIESTPTSITSSMSAHPRTWYVSRLPYTSRLPLPSWPVPFVYRRKVRQVVSHRWRWSNWSGWNLFDGRFWIHMTYRLPYGAVIMPLLREHAKLFRESLSPEDRDRLNAILKKYAPGKVRYTLPAIYSSEYVDLSCMKHWVDNPVPEKIPEIPGLSPEVKDARTEYKRKFGHRVPRPPLEPSKMMLLALPTLDIKLPGLDKWLLYEVRYKRVDRSVLQTMGTFVRGSFKAPDRRSRKYMRKRPLSKFRVGSRP